MDEDTILKYFDSLSLSDLIKCKESLTKTINRKHTEIQSKSPNDFVDYFENFIDNSSLQYQDIYTELLKLNFSPSSDNVVTKWLTATGQNYTWSSSKGNQTVKHPLDLSQYPAIAAIMSDINCKFGTDLNSGLVSYYKSGKSKIRYHSDDESSMDSSQGIYVVFFGVERIVDLNRQGKDGRSSPDFTLTTADGSLYVMKPGCQKYFVHRVRGDNSIVGARYSISFRHMLLNDDQQKPQAASHFVPPVIAPLDNSQPAPIIHNIQHATSITPAASHTAASHKPKRRRTTVLFGTSMTKYIQPNKLGFRGRKVVNISQSGAKINDVYDNVRDFYENHEAAKSNDVEKVIFSIGTNDVKFCRYGVSHLKKHIVRLIDLTKNIFPAAIILFQSCLPIKPIYSYIPKNVVEFNRLLRNLCLDYNCVYIDCFKDFLTRDTRYQNSDLFYDWLHLNRQGNGVLSTWLKYVVNENSYDRVLDSLLGIVT